MLKKNKTFAVLSLLLLTPCLASAFNPAGWQSNNNFPLMGSTEAVKGGTLRSY